MRRNLSQLLMMLLASASIGMTHAATTAKTHKSSHKGKTHHRKSKSKHASNNYMMGTASFYGENDGFQGRKMANGKVFNTNDVYSAAHPTLPLGTKLMVTNLANGRTIYVEVRDRMPKHGRVIDLSLAAAKYLGMHHRGLTKVELVQVSNQEFEQNKRYLEVDDGDSGTPS
jgi:rare lipoprotein A